MFGRLNQVRNAARGGRLAGLAAFIAAFLSGAGPALAQGAAACEAPDPREARAIYECAQTGAVEFDTGTCRSARDRYERLLRAAGMARGRTLQYLPSCEIIASVSLDLSGAVPAWNGCLGYPGGFDAEHFKRCVGSVPKSATCPSLVESYRRGLTAADKFGQLPRGYVDPDCETLAAALAAPEPAPKAGAQPERAGVPEPRAVPPQWVKCLDYDPANVAAHMERCIGPEFTRLTSCRDVQLAYERNLRSAYNGLPAGYVMVTCPEAQVIVRLGEEQAAARRRTAEAERLARADERARLGGPLRPTPTIARAPKPAGEVGAWFSWATGVVLPSILLLGLLTVIRRDSRGDGRGGWAGLAPFRRVVPASRPFSPFVAAPPQRTDWPDQGLVADSDDETDDETAESDAREPQTDPIPPSVREALEESDDDPLDDLERMIGMADVKKQVESLTAFVGIQQKRKEMGLPGTTQSYHLVLTGNPGTGKTTVARIIGRIYRQLGVIRKGHLVEVSRADLVAEYLGQTAVKVTEAVNRAMDGVLFVDEAYALTPERQDSYGEEAVVILMKQMDDHRDRLIVMAAGYKKEMDRFLGSNPGLESRFKTVIDFPDYAPDELAAIFRQICAGHHYVLSPQAGEKLRLVVGAIHANRRKGFGNGRAMRNLFEQSITRQASRLSASTDLSDDDLVTLTADDIPDSASG